MVYPKNIRIYYNHNAAPGSETEAIMEFQYNDHQIALYNNENELLAEVVLQTVNEDTVEITETFVDDRLRGQGIAGKLMQAVADHLREQNKKAVLICSYAQTWFGKHPEYHDLLERV